MPPLTELLFSFKGRIRRLHWWVTTIIVSLVAGGLTSILEIAARSTGSFTLDPNTDTIEPTGPFGLAVGVVGLANLWINFALSAKRLHDRDRTGWWLLWQVLILTVAIVLIVVAVAVPEEQRTPWATLAGLVGVAALAISLWLFVEIGFLRGTQGPNRFGPDPLGATQADAKL
jgi:uncharacterized membrane protein YhaH (DUF805 family)